MDSKCKITTTRIKSRSVKTKSINDLIKINILGNGPEILLSDGSILIFDSTQQYYSTMINEKIFISKSSYIDIAELKKLYLKSVDDINLEFADEVELYIVNDKPLYRFIIY